MTSNVKKNVESTGFTEAAYALPPPISATASAKGATTGGTTAAFAAGDGIGGIPATGLTRSAPETRRGYGKGVIPVDPRKFLYDRTRARTMAPISFGASKADRLDATHAGLLLARIHALVGIENEPENVILAFDKALFFEHTINGASLLQPGRGVLTVGHAEFELSIIKTVLGVDQRRFFRAFADEVASVNREVLDSYDPYEPDTVERHGQLVQVAVIRGLQKFPHLAHDSSDAGVLMSVEERLALMQSKRLVLDASVNEADKLGVRSSGAAAV